MDLSITDWISRKTCPVYLIQNPYDREVTVHFTVADIWRKKRPDLFEKAFRAWDLSSMKETGTSDGKITVTLAAGECRFIGVLKEAPVAAGHFICGTDGEELLCREVNCDEN